MKTLITLALLVSISPIAFAEDTATNLNKDPKISNDRNNVDRSCSNEQEVAHCGNDVVGKVLFKCINDYKEAHPDFKISTACTTAIEKLHADKMEKKAKTKK